MPYADRSKALASQRRWKARRKAEWIEANGPCQHCGGTENLEVDHIDPATKLLNPSHVWSRRPEVRAAELEKCQVLCHACHVKKKTDNREYKTGEACSFAKLRQRDVDAIRSLYGEGHWTQTRLAAEFKVSIREIHNIINRVKWKHEPPPSGA